MSKGKKCEEAIKRDYATQAFRLYAEHGVDIDTDDFLHWLDCQAVSMTISLLHSEGRDSVVDALQAVYFAESKKSTNKRDIDSRVYRFCSDHYVGRTTVYRWLSYARGVFLAIRFHAPNIP